MKTTNTRKMISAMQISLDGFIEDDNGTTDWVDSWADAIQLIENVDMFLLGGSMQPGYGEYWGSIYDNPQKVPLSNPELPSQQGRLPTESEIAYARLAAKTPHIVLSRKLKDISWPQGQIVRDIDEARTAVNANLESPQYWEVNSTKYSCRFIGFDLIRTGANSINKEEIKPTRVRNKRHLPPYRARFDT